MTMALARSFASFARSNTATRTSTFNRHLNGNVACMNFFFSHGCSVVAGKNGKSGPRLDSHLYDGGSAGARQQHERKKELRWWQRKDGQCWKVGMVRDELDQPSRRMQFQLSQEQRSVKVDDRGHLPTNKVRRKATETAKHGLKVIC